MNNIMNNIVTPFNELWTTKGHNKVFMTKRSQFSVMNDIINHHVNDKKGRNIVNDSFAPKSDGLLVKMSLKIGSTVYLFVNSIIWNFKKNHFKQPPKCCLFSQFKLN